MLNISHFYKLLLSKDIEIDINSKIEVIKNANKWSDLNVKCACENIDLTTLGVNDIKYHAALLENISKLSIDLLLDYDYYKNFSFKRQFRCVDYDEKLRKLGYEIDDDYWHNVNKPSKDTVIMNVFLSCLYNSLIEIMDNQCSEVKFDGNDNCEKVLMEDLDLNTENKSFIEIEGNEEMEKSIKLTENCDEIDDNIEGINETECETNKLEYQGSFSDVGEGIFGDEISQICTGQLDSSQLVDEINIGGEIGQLNTTNCDKSEILGTHSGINEIVNAVSATGAEECPLCDAQIEPGDEYCTACGEPVANLSISSNDVNDNIERSETYKAHLPYETIVSGENEKSGSINTNKLELIEKDEATYKNMKIFHDILSKNKNQWVCRSCEYLNQFSLTNCQACNAQCKMIGYWICCHCSCVSEMSTDTCSACDCKNGLIVPANKWKCWKPICNFLNDDKFRFCHKCGLQRTQPVAFSDLVERKVQGKIVKFWICEICWKYNNDKSQFCVKKNCEELRFKQTNKIPNEKGIKTDDSDLYFNKEQTVLCTPKITHDNNNNTLNENDEGKDVGTQENYSNIDRNFWICKNCTVRNTNESNKCSCCESLNIVETEWKCWKKNCERMNKIEHNYCQTCKLDKDPPDPETKLVKYYTGNEVREIWICGKCEKYNTKDNVKCESKNCGAFRFYTNNDSKGDKNRDANENEIKTNPSQWTCDRCSFINNGNGKRCTVCNYSNCDKNEICQTSNSWKLDRYGCNNRDAFVKCQDKNDIKDVWICQKCFKYNSLSNTICGGKTCKISRF